MCSEWADHMDPDGTLHWVLPDRRKSYYDEDYLPKSWTGWTKPGTSILTAGLSMEAGRRFC